MTGAMPGPAALVRTALWAMLAVALSGCAQPARVGGMVAQHHGDPAAAATNHPLRNAIALGEVTGGETAGLLRGSKVGNREFGEALHLSLEAHGLLAPVPSAAPYVLNADLAKLAQPSGGLALTVTSTVTYRLIEPDGSQGPPMLRYEDTITAPYTAELSNSLLMARRLRLANEGSIRENIGRFIARLLDMSGSLGSG